MTISDEITPNQDRRIDILNNYDFCQTYKWEDPGSLGKTTAGAPSIWKKKMLNFYPFLSYFISLFFIGKPSVCKYY